MDPGKVNCCTLYVNMGWPGLRWHCLLMPLGLGMPGVLAAPTDLCWLVPAIPSSILSLP